jgi:hypothetical protein
MDDKMRAGIEKAKECRQICLETLEYCKSKGGEHASEEHLKLLEDCAKICETSADFMERGSDHHSKVCAVCADICDKCAESCEMMEDDEQMQKCAQICRECAESCRGMTSLMDRVVS